VYFINVSVTQFSHGILLRVWL